MPMKTHENVREMVRRETNKKLVQIGLILGGLFICGLVIKEIYAGWYYEKYTKPAQDRAWRAKMQGYMHGGYGGTAPQPEEQQ